MGSLTTRHLTSSSIIFLRLFRMTAFANGTKKNLRDLILMRRLRGSNCAAYLRWGVHDDDVRWFQGAGKGMFVGTGVHHKKRRKASGSSAG